MTPDSAPPRDAATVILWRARRDGTYEVLLTRRPETMRFMGGALVFPGGALDAADADPALAAVCDLEPEAAAARLGEGGDPAQALALHCCAIRELFEEAGILLADRGGVPVSPGSVRDDYLPSRKQIVGSFAKFVRREGLTLRTSALRRYLRLVTPPGVSPYRFDARFLLAECPAGQNAVPDPDEVAGVAWMTPADAIEQGERRQLPIPIPTMAVLQGLAEVPSAEQLRSLEGPVRDVRADRLSPLVTRVLAPNPGIFTGPGTNTYVVGTTQTAIVDPAVGDAIFIERVVREAAARGPVKIVLLTHLHPDHIGGAWTLAERMNCPVGVWAGAAERVPVWSVPLRDGDSVAVAGATLDVSYAPGHASHHVVFRLREEDALLAGDVVSGAGTVVIAPPDGNMGDYLETLEGLLRLSLRRIYPGHGPPIDDPRALLESYIRHRHEREEQILACLHDGIERIPDVVARVYRDVASELHPLAEMSVLAHLELLERRGRVRRTGQTWQA